MPDALIDELPASAPSTEAYQTLLTKVGRKSPTIPADLLVRHVLDRVPASEWPVRVEAMDALLRRLDASRRDELRIESRPGGGRTLGPYATRAQGLGRSGPTGTVLHGVDPIEARCDCPDFVKNSLGICKHLFSVVEHIHARPRLLQQAMKEQATRGPKAGLEWDPVRPLTGDGDWLARVAWNRPAAANGSKLDGRAEAMKWFRREGEGRLVLRRSYTDQPTRRRDLVEDLLKLLPADGRDPALIALLKAERDRLRAADRGGADPGRASGGDQG